ncbi:MAG: DNA/RNA non-specific endonuclease [Planctomycetota bacterium]|jgi:endonuclease G
MKVATVAVLLVALCACSKKAFTTPPGKGGGQVTWVGALVSAEHRIMGDIMTYGFPSRGMLLYREGYVCSYDTRRRVPHWVAERLNAKRLRPGGTERTRMFRVDLDLDPEFRSQSNDYTGTPYVRGRLAAASNHLGDPVALEQTYYLSNVAPQLGRAFRQSFWVPFETQVRDWAREVDDLYVFTGPLFLPEADAEGRSYVRYEVIGANQVAVPTHFFKVMLRERDGRREMQAFLVPHRPLETDTPLEQFLVSVDDVERVAGLDFFDELSEPTQSLLEARNPGIVWDR